MTRALRPWLWLRLQQLWAWCMARLKGLNLAWMRRNSVCRSKVGQSVTTEGQSCDAQPGCLLMGLPPHVLEHIACFSARTKRSGALLLTCTQLRAAGLRAAPRLCLYAKWLGSVRSHRELCEVLRIRLQPLRHLQVVVSDVWAYQRLLYALQYLTAAGGATLVQHVDVQGPYHPTTDELLPLTAPLGCAFPELLRVTLSRWHLPADTPLWASLASCSALAQLSLFSVRLAPNQPQQSIASSLAHVRAVEVSSSCRGCEQLLQALGPQLTRLTLPSIRLAAAAAASTVTPFPKLHSIKLDAIFASDMEVLSEQKQVRSIICNRLYVSTNQAQQVKRLSCNWNNFQVCDTTLLGEYTVLALPQGVRTLKLGLLQVVPRDSPEEMEQCYRAVATQILQAAQRVELGHSGSDLCVEMQQPIQRLGLQAASACFTALINGLSPLAPFVTSISIKLSQALTVVVGTGQVHALAAGFGTQLQHLRLGPNIVLAPAAWGALLAVLPALNSISLFVCERWGSIVAASMGGQLVPWAPGVLDDASVAALVQLCTLQAEARRSLVVQLRGGLQLGTQLHGMRPQLAGSGALVLYKPGRS